MSLVTVNLDEATLEALQAEADRRAVSIDVVIAESVREHLDVLGPRHRLAVSGVGASDGVRRAREADEALAGASPPRRLAFVGMGHSGDGERSTRYKDYRRASMANKTSQDV